MSDANRFDFPWVIILLKGTKFAVSAGAVQAMVRMPHIVEVPQSPSYVRGVAEMRGKVIPFVDLRLRLGMSSFIEEVDDFCRTMDKREEDHRHWLEELQASVREQREFSLATDHHQCKFGKWYDSYKPTDHTLASLVGKFRNPHRAIHGIAVRVKKLESEGKMDEAHAIIDQCRDNEMAEMISLFAKIKVAYRENNREIALVLIHGDSSFAIAADSVESIEHLSEDVSDAARIDGITLTDGGLVNSIGRRKNHDVLVQILDHTRLMVGADLVSDVDEENEKTLLMPAAAIGLASA